MEERTVKIPQHHHCRVCGKTFIGDGLHCSDECRERDGAEARRKLRRYLVCMAVLWAVVVVAVFAIGI